jgi:hypothetical protein
LNVDVDDDVEFIFDKKAEEQRSRGVEEQRSRGAKRPLNPLILYVQKFQSSSHLNKLL